MYLGSKVQGTTRSLSHSPPQTTTPTSTATRRTQPARHSVLALPVERGRVGPHRVGRGTRPPNHVVLPAARTPQEPVRLALRLRRPRARRVCRLHSRPPAARALSKHPSFPPKLQCPAWGSRSLSLFPEEEEGEEAPFTQRDRRTSAQIDDSSRDRLRRTRHEILTRVRALPPPLRQSPPASVLIVLVILGKNSRGPSFCSNRVFGLPGKEVARRKRAAHCTFCRAVVARTSRDPTQITSLEIVPTRGEVPENSGLRQL